MESKECEEIQEGKSYEPIDASIHHVFYETERAVEVKAVDGILPKCEGEILINPQLEEYEYDYESYGNMDCPFQRKGYKIMYLDFWPKLNSPYACHYNSLLNTNLA